MIQDVEFCAAGVPAGRLGFFSAAGHDPAHRMFLPSAFKRRPHLSYL